MRCENKLGPRAWVAMSLLFGVVSFAGCGPRDNAQAPAGPSSGRDVPPPSPKRYTIAVIPKGETAEFWKSVHAGAIHAERELGNVDVKWQGPLREDNREEQIRVVETFVAQGVDGIVLAPLDRTALVRPVHEAIAGGTPVLIIDSGLDSNEILSYVATNNFNGGAMAARRLGELLGGNGNCILLRYQVGSQSTEERERGFLDALGKEFPRITVISQDQHAGATRESATQAMENLLGRFGDKLDGVFAPCEPVAFGCLRALEDAGRAGKVKLVGFDATATLVDALRAGKIHGLVLQDPFKMGDLGVRMMVDHLQGKNVARNVSTGEYLVTKENMDQPEMRRLHSPDLRPYLGG